jgi:hypothetical protein
VPIELAYQKALSKIMMKGVNEWFWHVKEGEWGMVK